MRSLESATIFRRPMVTTPYVLAAILQVAQPGYSDLSRVYLPFEECQSDCSEGLLRVRGHAPSLDYRGTGFAHRAIWEGWSVRETRVEGLTRFVTIASSIATVVNDASLSAKGKRSLAHLLVTIARHESAFWRSTHDGTLRGAAGEKGLFQVHPSLPEFNDCHPGVDLDSTLSCTYVAADLLLRAQRMCRTIPGTIAAYGSGQGCRPEGTWVDGVQSRLDTLDRTYRKAIPLHFDVQLAMSLNQ